MTIIRRCEHCGCFIKHGQAPGHCEVCARRRQGQALPRRFCDCGQPAVARLQVRIGRPENTFTTVLDLCADCLKLENEMWREQ